MRHRWTSALAGCASGFAPTVAAVLLLAATGCASGDAAGPMTCERMLASISPRIRVKGLGCVERGGRSELLGRVILMLDDPDPVVRSRAARTIGQLRPGWPMDDYDSWAEHRQRLSVITRLERLYSEQDHGR